MLESTHYIRRSSDYAWQLFLASLVLVVCPHIFSCYLPLTFFILGRQPSHQLFLTYPPLASYAHLFDVCIIPTGRTNERDGAHYHPCRILPLRTLRHGSPHGWDQCGRTGCEWDASRTCMVVAHLGVRYGHGRYRARRVCRVGSSSCMVERLVR